MHWQTTRFLIDLTKPKVMGIVNITPDSFSQNGDYSNPKSAIQYAESLLSEGADILDLGAESTRPGAKPIDDQEEWQRLAPMFSEALRWDTPISVDTYHPATMQKALDMGCDIINDVYALRQVGAIETIGQHPNCGIVLMHMHLEPQTMQVYPMQGQAIATVSQFLLDRCKTLQAIGVAKQRICADPGIGFGKTVEQNFALLSKQKELSHLGLPLLVGWSRKSSLGKITGLDPHERSAPSIAAALIAIQKGAHIVRVHDVKATKAALAVWEAVST